MPAEHVDAAKASQSENKNPELDIEDPFTKVGGFFN